MGILDFLEEDSEDSAVVVPPSDVEVVATPLSAASKSVVPTPQSTGQLIPAPKSTLTQEEQVQSALRELENEILQESLEHISHAQAWAEIAKELDPKDEAEIPEEWIAKYGEKVAKKRYRIARAATMKSADAPVALKENARVAIGILKARAHEKTGPRILNLSLVEMPNAIIQFPEQEVK
jgi:hypothetical protein